MNGFYEYYRDDKKNLVVYEGKSFIFPAHFHHKIELFILSEGIVKVTCNEKTYELDEGCIAFFNSYDVHSYDEQSSNTKGYCLIIPAEYFARFCKRIQNKQVKNAVVKNKNLCEEICSLVKNYLVIDNSKEVKSNCIELILSLLEQNLEFTDVVSDSEATVLVKKILRYINENFREKISLDSISKEFGYSTAHISRTFGRFVKKSIPDYVNEIRLNEVNRLTSETDRKITELIFTAGFNSLQTYYRFKSKFVKSNNKKND